MEKNKFIHNILIVLIVTMTFYVVGCTSMGSSSSSEKTYKVGTDGLVLSFSKSNPTTVYEGEEFGTSLFIKNIGGTTVTSSNPGSLRITYDTYRLAGKDNTAEMAVNGIYLEGKSLYYPQGTEAPVEFYFKANELTHLREGAITEITYNLCYPYATEFTTMTCIDTKTANNADDAAACKTEVYNGADGQGGPIVVTRIEPEIMLQQDYVRPQYKIYVENLGNGYVMNRQSCDVSNVNELFGTGYSDYSGKVTVYAELSGQRLDCGPDKTGVMRVVDSESVITCSLPRDAGTNSYSRTKKNYVTPLSIKIAYTYVLLEKQEIEIKRNDLIEREPTQGLCNSYQIEYEGKCVDKCVFCSKDPTNYRCVEGQTLGITFTKDFSCACNSAQCTEKEKNGNCIRGNYCASGVYCCNSLTCTGSKPVAYNGNCYNWCDYCAGYGQNDARCNFGDTAQKKIVPSNFRCDCTEEDLTTAKDFISRSDLCDVNSGKYCCTKT